MTQNIVTSGLSQWVVFAGTPYSIEIQREEASVDWAVDVIDAVEKETIWQGTSRDDITGLMSAMSYIHTLVPMPNDNTVVQLRPN